jgi:(E)-4-hydroxy-3-methylbut-2-enyl-diphosphate synthase
MDGEKVTTLKGEGIAEAFKRLVEDYVQRRYGGQA